MGDMRANTNDLIEVARKAGWKVSKTKNGHWKLIPPTPDGSIIHTGSTPSDYRTAKNLRAQLRRAGLEV